MTGTVLALNVEPGQSIDPSTPLMTIADLGELIVETDVDEAYATQLRKGQAAVLQLAGETLLRDGRIDFVSQQVDAATGGLAIELGFDAPYCRIQECSRGIMPLPQPFVPENVRPFRSQVRLVADDL